MILYDSPFRSSETQNHDETFWDTAFNLACETSLHEASMIDNLDEPGISMLSFLVIKYTSNPPPFPIPRK